MFPSACYIYFLYPIGSGYRNMCINKGLMLQSQLAVFISFIYDLLYGIRHVTGHILVAKIYSSGTNKVSRGCFKESREYCHTPLEEHVKQN